MRKSNVEKEPGEDFNVRVKHGQIWRENAEPSERYNRIPWWLKHGIYAPLFIWALWYLIVYSGGFNSEEYYEGVDFVNYSAKPSEDGDNGVALTSSSKPDGKAVYTQVCAACHQATGQGITGAFPPLAGSDWVSGEPKKLAALVLHGLAGEIVVNGTTYNGVMPPWEAQLSDADIAAVLTYIRSDWGNSSPPVDAAMVSEIRGSNKGRAPWSAAELDEAFGK